MKIKYNTIINSGNLKSKFIKKYPFGTSLDKKYSPLDKLNGHPINLVLENNSKK